MKLERQHFSAWMQWLTSSWGHDGAKKQYEAVLGAVDRALLDSDVRPFAPLHAPVKASGSV